MNSCTGQEPCDVQSLDVLVASRIGCLAFIYIRVPWNPRIKPSMGEGKSHLNSEMALTLEVVLIL